MGALWGEVGVRGGEELGAGRAGGEEIRLARGLGTIRVSDRADEDCASAQQLPRVTGDINPHQRDHPAEADYEPERPDQRRPPWKHRH